MLLLDVINWQKPKHHKQTKHESIHPLYGYTQVMKHGVSYNSNVATPMTYMTCVVFFRKYRYHNSP